jgi:hypothetical protein
VAAGAGLLDTASSSTCGVSYAHDWFNGGNQGYGSERSLRSLRELRELGVTRISLTNFAFLESLTASRVFDMELRGGSERRADMLVDAQRARELGMEVMIKPHIWVRGGAWHGQLAPDDWDQFWDEYTVFMLDNARMAQQAQAAWFVVGTELVTAVAQRPDRMRDLIAQVRAVFDGQLVYAANWDECERVEIWDAVDAIGVQMYAPIATVNDTSPERLRTMAAEWLARYEAVAVTFGKPLVLTEVGFVNRPGTAIEPHVWPEHVEDVDTVAGEAAQAQAYAAIIEVFGQSGHVQAMYWWKWYTNPDTADEGDVGFSPRGRTAEDVLRRACAQSE